MALHQDLFHRGTALPSTEGRINSKHSECHKANPRWLVSLKLGLSSTVEGATSQNLWLLSTEGQAVEQRWVIAQGQGEGAAVCSL